MERLGGRERRRELGSAKAWVSIWEAESWSWVGSKTLDATCFDAEIVVDLCLVAAGALIGGKPADLCSSSFFHLDRVTYA